MAHAVIPPSIPFACTDSTPMAVYCCCILLGRVARWSIQHSHDSILGMCKIENWSRLDAILFSCIIWLYVPILLTFPVAVATGMPFIQTQCCVHLHRRRFKKWTNPCLRDSSGRVAHWNRPHWCWRHLHLLPYHWSWTTSFDCSQLLGFFIGSHPIIKGNRWIHRTNPEHVWPKTGSGNVSSCQETWRSESFE